MTEIEHARWAALLVPRRLALLRLQVLDLVLRDLAHMRLEGVRTLPPVVSAMISDLARAHDATLPSIADAPSHEIRIAERELLVAQGQVMRELASLGSGLRGEQLDFA
ncbi:MAG: hypothetical protein QOH92_64 [Chloroflexota bacterium]|jgi:hypothetical protein|nr:hypothetical protein [Chloroflexota bacterium]